VISVVLDERCTGCGRCIEICPTDVFEEGAGGHPRIARVLDCQTCFACELHCPADAIYVDPNCEAPRSVAAEVASIAPSLGQYRLNAGWGEHPEENPNEFWMMERGFEWAFAERARERAATQSVTPAYDD
jgi:NAD-dependent dihydropyrimidine dehydrogenase PreA subunit